MNTQNYSNSLVAAIKLAKAMARKISTYHLV